MDKKTQLILITAILLLSFTVNYVYRYNYALPIHSDEYDHLAIVNEMDKTARNVWYDPYIVEKRVAVRNLELNYDIFLLHFFHLTGLELYQIPLIIPVVFSFLLSLSAFIFIDFISGKKLAALFASIFVFFLHNNIAFLGYWLLVPMAFGIAMVPLLSYLFLRALNSWSYTIAFYVVLANVMLVHAVYVVILLPAFLLFLLLAPKEIKKNSLKIIFGVILLFLLSQRFVRWNFFDLGLTFKKIYDFLVWPYGIYTGFYPFVPYLSVPVIFLCAVGILFLLVRLYKNSGKSILKLLICNTESSQEKFFHYSKLAVIFILLMVFVRLFADSSGICLMGPCRRTTPGTTVMILSVAGLGLYAMMRLFNYLFSDLNVKSQRILHGLVFLTVCVFIVQQLFTQPFTHMDEVYHNIEVEEIDAIKWIKSSSERKDVIMALPWTAKAVSVIADRKVNDTGLARYGVGLESLADVTRFYFDSDCSEKVETFNKYKTTIGYGSDSVVDCNSFDVLYREDGHYVFFKNHE